MSRRRRAVKREILPDPKYRSLLVAKFVNSIMERGKKRLAEHVFYNALNLIAEKTKKEGIDVFNKAINNCKPYLEVKSRRVGGANYQVPVEVRSERQQSLAIRWLIQYAKERKGKSMPQKLAEEFISASNGEGGAIKKREDTHRMAEANKAFAHFRW
jgi:small subunit ribosomal protein S7